MIPPESEAEEQAREDRRMNEDENDTDPMDSGVEYDRTVERAHLHRCGDGIPVLEFESTEFAHQVGSLLCSMPTGFRFLCVGVGAPADLRDAIENARRLSAVRQATPQGKPESPAPLAGERIGIIARVEYRARIDHDKKLLYIEARTALPQRSTEDGWGAWKPTKANDEILDRIKHDLKNIGSIAHDYTLVLETGSV